VARTVINIDQTGASVPEHYFPFHTMRLPEDKTDRVEITTISIALIVSIMLFTFLAHYILHA
jgi:hypothetical protein